MGVYFDAKNRLILPGGRPDLKHPGRPADAGGFESEGMDAQGSLQIPFPPAPKRNWGLLRKELGSPQKGTGVSFKWLRGADSEQLILGVHQMRVTCTPKNWVPASGGVLSRDPFSTITFGGLVTFLPQENIQGEFENLSLRLGPTALFLC